ncbi:MAG: rRNA maturation RNase YbeY [Alphaproteobacteria bacterium CG11_big_fil_rev_8_21_14_0_20_44_7]|nr:MAG: rRNA maturation RNase YbeY [Alphaproteobacteria bacterium CG11_big_fil_rev_8_21_14_0_20_44_7]
MPSADFKITYEIAIDSSVWKKHLPDSEKIIARALQEIAENCKLNGEVSILLTNDAKIRQLNNDFRGKDKPTNVLSFPQHSSSTPHLIGGDMGGLGDIALALETLQREAAEQEKTLPAHFTHLFVHGVLHLLGYDHEDDDEQEDMENKEVEILHKLGVGNPYI